MTKEEMREERAKALAVSIAFPVPGNCYTEGMKLRTWLVGMALAGTSSPAISGLDDGKRIALRAVKIADAAIDELAR